MAPPAWPRLAEEHCVSGSCSLRLSGSFANQAGDSEGCRLGFSALQWRPDRIYPHNGPTFLSLCDRLGQGAFQFPGIPARGTRARTEHALARRMIKIKSYIVIAFCYRKANILRKWSKILHFCYGNKGLCHGCRSH